jgi:hypothetical protein
VGSGHAARADPNVFPLQFPPDIASRYVLLLDPMLGVLESSDSCLNLLSHVLLATGGSAMKAVEVLMEHGVPEERIIFINLVSKSPLTPGCISPNWTLLDLRPRGSQSLLQQVPSTTRGTPSSVLVNLLITALHWIDNRLDRQRFEREGVYHPWFG